MSFSPPGARDVRCAYIIFCFALKICRMQASSNKAHFSEKNDTMIVELG